MHIQMFNRVCIFEDINFAIMFWDELNKISYEQGISQSSLGYPEDSYKRLCKLRDLVKLVPVVEKIFINEAEIKLIYGFCKA